MRNRSAAGHRHLVLQTMQDDALRPVMQDVTGQQQIATGQGSDAAGTRTIAALPPR